VAVVVGIHLVAQPQATFTESGKHRVAFGIMIGFAFNLIFATASSADTTIGLILGAPFVPALMLLVGLWFCPESPRYYMRPRSPNYNPAKAFEILLRLRNTEVRRSS
jgi:hypothetical protein